MTKCILLYVLIQSNVYHCANFHHPVMDQNFDPANAKFKIIQNNEPIFDLDAFGADGDYGKASFGRFWSAIHWRNQFYFIVRKPIPICSNWVAFAAHNRRCVTYRDYIISLNWWESYQLIIIHQFYHLNQKLILIPCRMQHHNITNLVVIYKSSENRNCYPDINYDKLNNFLSFLCYSILKHVRNVQSQNIYSQINVII